MNWTPSKSSKYGPTWESDDCNFEIAVASNGLFRLIWFEDTDGNGDFCWWDFKTLAEAKAYAEKL